MIRWLTLAAVAASLVWADAAQAVDYSADRVAKNSTGQTKITKIYASNGKVRVVPPDGQSYLLLDTTKNTAYIVVPTQKTYIEEPKIRATYIGASFIAGVNPCAKIASTGGICTTKKLGTDTLNGRPAEKWEVTQTGPGGQNGTGVSFTSTMWIDRALGTIVKAQSVRGTLQLQNIHIGAQPANLFALPAGFKKQDAAGPPETVTIPAKPAKQPG